MKHLLFTIATCFIFVSSTYSQDIQWGNSIKNLSFLKGQKTVKIEFKYDIEKINANQSEAEFIAEQKTIRNLKNDGMGDKWEKDWFSYRSFLFNPSFENNFNKHIKGAFEVKEKCEDCKYKILIHVKELKTGKDNKVSTTFGQVPAGGSFWVDIVDESQNNVVASFQLNDMRVVIAPRNDDNFFPWLNEAFSKAGRLVATEILKNIK
jgi:hypothetical protein